MKTSCMGTLFTVVLLACLASQCVTARDTPQATKPQADSSTGGAATPPPSADYDYEAKKLVAQGEAGAAAAAASLVARAEASLEDLLTWMTGKAAGSGVMPKGHLVVGAKADANKASGDLPFTSGAMINILDWQKKHRCDVESSGYVPPQPYPYSYDTYSYDSPTTKAPAAAPKADLVKDIPTPAAGDAPLLCDFPLEPDNSSFIPPAPASFVLMGADYTTHKIADGSVIYLKNQNVNKYCRVGEKDDDYPVTCDDMTSDYESPNRQQFYIELVSDDEVNQLGGKGKAVAVYLRPALHPGHYCRSRGSGHDYAVVCDTKETQKGTLPHSAVFFLQESSAGPPYPAYPQGNDASAAYME